MPREWRKILCWHKARVTHKNRTEKHKKNHTSEIDGGLVHRNAQQSISNDNSSTPYEKVALNNELSRPIDQNRTGQGFALNRSAVGI